MAYMDPDVVYSKLESDNDLTKLIEALQGDTDASVKVGSVKKRTAWLGWADRNKKPIQSNPTKMSELSELAKSVAGSDAELSNAVSRFVRIFTKQSQPDAGPDNYGLHTDLPGVNE